MSKVNFILVAVFHWLIWSNNLLSPTLWRIELLPEHQQSHVECCENSTGHKLYSLKKRVVLLQSEVSTCWMSFVQPDLWPLRVLLSVFCISDKIWRLLRGFSSSCSPDKRGACFARHWNENDIIHIVILAATTCSARHTFPQLVSLCLSSECLCAEIPLPKGHFLFSLAWP